MTIKFTCQPPKVGQKFKLNGQTWEVIAAHQYNRWPGRYVLHVLPAVTEKRGKR